MWLPTWFSAFDVVVFAAEFAALVAAWLATSPVLGPFDAGSGASEAAGSGLPSRVVPIRMTCETGTPFSFDISFAISAIPEPMPGCDESSCGDTDEGIAPLNTVPILTAIRLLKSRTSLYPGISGTIHISLVIAMPPVCPDCWSVASAVILRMDSDADKPATGLVVPVLVTVTLNFICGGGVALAGCGVGACCGCAWAFFTASSIAAFIS